MKRVRHAVYPMNDFTSALNFIKTHHTFVHIEGYSSRVGGGGAVGEVGLSV